MNRLMLYHNLAHAVQSYSEKTEAISLPTSADLASLFLYNQAGEVVPFTYVSESSGLSLLNRETGERHSAEAHKYGQITRGELVSYSNGEAVLSCGGQLTIIPAVDRLIIDGCPSTSGPYLVIKKSVKTGPLYLSYLLNNLTWRTVIRGLLRDGKIYLQLAGVVTNNSDQNYCAEVTLLAGDVNTQHSAPIIAMRSLEAAPAQMGTALEEYPRYSVGRTSLDRRTVIELESFSLEVEKLYLASTTASGVKFGYRGTLPRSLPAASLDLYQLGGAYQIETYLGSDSFSSKQKGEELRVTIGSASTVTCTTILGQTRTSDTLTETIEASCANYQEQQVTLLLLHTVNTAQVLEVTPPATRSGAELSWSITLPPQGKVVFTATVITANSKSDS